MFDDIQIKQSVVVNLPARDIFAYLSNLANMVDWSSAVIAVKLDPSTPMGVGATTRNTLRFLGKWLEITFEVVVYETERYLGLKSISGGGPCFFGFQLEATDEGRTTLHREATIRLIDGIVDLDASVITNAIYRQAECDLLTLKDVMEARAALSDINYK